MVTPLSSPQPSPAKTRLAQLTAGGQGGKMPGASDRGGPELREPAQPPDDTLTILQTIDTLRAR
jgi:hypothetical protein